MEEEMVMDNSQGQEAVLMAEMQLVQETPIQFQVQHKLLAMPLDKDKTERQKHKLEMLVQKAMVVEEEDIMVVQLYKKLGLLQIAQEQAVLVILEGLLMVQQLLEFNQVTEKHSSHGCQFYKNIWAAIEKVAALLFLIKH